MYENQTSMHHKLLIIGAGAAGLMAAVTARDMGIDTAILESNDRIGKKILMTGDGRCNITNDSTATGTDEAVALSRKYHSNQAGFPLAVLQQFGIRQTIDFFSLLGLPLTRLKEGLMYPMSLQAAAVQDIFQLALEDRNVPVYLKNKVLDVTVSTNHPRFMIKCQTETEEGEVQEVVYTSEYLFLCAGGLTGPNAGKEPPGYTLAERLGHSLVEPLPAIVQLKLKYPNMRALTSIKFQGQAHIFVNGKNILSASGEIAFTDYGISGPAALQLSRVASYHLARGENVTVSVDLMPDRTEEELVNFLEMLWETFGHRTVADSLVGIFNKKLVSVLLKEAGIDQQPQLLCQDLSMKTKGEFYRILKRWEFKVTDTNGFTNAQVTAGGIDTSELIEGTLESKLVPGLYLAGEVMDVDGDFGGYNLQWAWSSGYVAAMALAKSIQ
ncbi:aminoacetone oxidase family FAD-binding enzyme [Paenibacillus sp. B2(2019)]|uniref:aminoacetone oxidase family FAD-binding enzyme n=1 Tax=Paenibacillus sp. B2(2019) TaxID=2607754 RepID=UPI0011F1C7BE|nr:aminoacetone oxidase family FAD-binding enzyme [Paenibacillus sp. B2(2019)]KAA1184282.1 aminoacetone oxidase family FAD-binding enzyme [Paenibacillus sp. B2(2019)]